MKLTFYSLKLSLCNVKLVSPTLFCRMAMLFRNIALLTAAILLTLTEAASISISYELYFGAQAMNEFYYFHNMYSVLWTGSWCCCKTCMTDMCATHCLWLRVKRTSGKTTLWADKDSTPRMVSSKKFRRCFGVYMELQKIYRDTHIWYIQGLI